MGKILSIALLIIITATLQIQCFWNAMRAIPGDWVGFWCLRLGGSVTNSSGVSM